ncbi:alpha/beta hydrolase-fold protein [Anaerolineales bacterium HSG6]|nr:alpha/beta hydrolase-fold protein [Anaerolineales bacterium HSG6]MDM8531515.1 alpha/beta hydrolase-fold protein [Anaerolineales bacterium HSG25]
MKIDYLKIWSRNLGQDMEFKIYGHTGKPMLVFPTSWGKFYEYEDRGMIEACAPLIESGKITVFAIDTIDPQSWQNEWASPGERARRHNSYDRYVSEEINQFIRDYRHWEGRFISTGCSSGAYHAINFFFRHPDMFDSVIGLSGTYSLHSIIGDYMDNNVYYNSPLLYLPKLQDPWYIDRYRQSRIILCVGQGAWEDRMRADTDALAKILREKNIPYWSDLWGLDVDHDWNWWRKQIIYFLSNLNL